MYSTLESSNSNNVEFKPRSKARITEKSALSDCSQLIALLKTSADLPEDTPFLPDCKSHCLRTPILLAVASGHVGNMKKLASVGYSINEPDRHGMSPLSHAARNGDLEIVQNLTDLKANPYSIDHYGCSPLHKAASWGRSEILTLLFNKIPKLDANFKTKPVACSPTSIAESKIEAPLHLALRLNPHSSPINMIQRQATVEVLLKNGADPNSYDMNGDTPLIVAAKTGNWGAMCRLVRAGANPKIKNTNNESAIQFINKSNDVDLKGKLAAKVIVSAPDWVVGSLEPFCWSRK
mmetsp:Transcript_5389/g.7010  ORF Transcript_5389/g.7010 Transcript_5389/m.7010 type:complete len:293 (-) Transcript_5389:449-1327(-)